MVSLVITDIDGTITGDDRAVHLKCVRYLRELQKRGILVGIATGNTLYYSRSAATLLGFEGPLIAENGGIVAVDDEEISTVPEEDVELIQEAYRELRRRLGVRRTEPPGLRRTEVAIYRDVPVEEIERVLDGLGYSDRIEVVDTGFAYHLKSKQVDKGKGLLVICERLGIDPNDVVAIGDGDNDAPLLKASGLGVAPANATENVKRIADVVLDAEDGDGVATFLRNLLEEVDA
ncbi:phosphoglycolate phosphatase [Methanopyrus sp. KOL6]|uniref:phosphoglycolate phosphatase n=1 Tax=Methanopyrus sp. KOL6 TaxID=1937004 RepID=UPI000B4AB344|nr:phosphoglycolate phosphatase [Methanopyrus sp. KOL6]